MRGPSAACVLSQPDAAGQSSYRAVSGLLTCIDWDIPRASPFYGRQVAVACSCIWFKLLLAPLCLAPRLFAMLIVCQHVRVAVAGEALDRSSKAAVCVPDVRRRAASQGALSPVSSATVQPSGASFPQAPAHPSRPFALSSIFAKLFCGC